MGGWRSRLVQQKEGGRAGKRHVRIWRGRDVYRTKGDGHVYFARICLGSVSKSLGCVYGAEPWTVVCVSKNNMATFELMYAAAVRVNHPDPAKMAATALRCRERALAMDAAKRKVIVLVNPPPTTTASQAAPGASKKTKAAAGAATTGPQCTARTLEGRQCPFRAASGCGAFCRKHFHMV